MHLILSGAALSIAKGRAVEGRFMPMPHFFTRAFVGTTDLNGFRFA